MEKGKRIPWIDIAKALVMLLVAFGHTMRGGSGQRIVYAFHVPAFFFLAGMTCGTDHPLRRIKKDIRQLMIPYYCFGLISIGIYCVLGEFAAARFDMNINRSVSFNILGLLYGSPGRGGLQYNTPLWFLPCLFVTKLMYYGLDRVCRGRPGPVMGLAVVMGAAGFALTALRVPELPFSFALALKMLPFFQLGRLVFQRIRGKTPAAPAAAGMGIVLVLGACVIGFLAPKVNYSSDSFPDIPAFLTGAVLGSLGICLVSVGIGRSRVLEYVGRNTLGILVMHKFPVLFFQTLGPLRELLANCDSLRGNLWGAAVAAVCVFLSLGVAAAVKRFAPFLLGGPREDRHAGQ